MDFGLAVCFVNVADVSGCLSSGSQWVKRSRWRSGFRHCQMANGHVAIIITQPASVSLVIHSYRLHRDRRGGSWGCPGTRDTDTTGTELKSYYFASGYNFNTLLFCTKSMKIAAIRSVNSWLKIRRNAFLRPGLCGVAVLCWGLGDTPKSCPGPPNF